MAVSWSHKYSELFASLGLESDVHEFRELNPKALIDTFESGWSKRRELQALILDKTKHFRAKIDSLFNEVSDRISGRVAKSYDKNS